MKHLVGSSYRYLLFLGFVVHVIAAFYSEGFHHPDEHFQILEFSNYKLGNSPVSDLAWEFNAQERAALQPFLAFLVIKLINLIGIYNPFWYALVLRLLAGLFAWYLTCQISLLLLHHFKTELGKKIFILLGQTLWFVPYINVRYSSENLAGITLLFAVYLILASLEKKQTDNPVFLAWAGLLLGFSFFFRFQIALAILGLGAWLLIVYRISLSNLLTVILTGIFAIIVCVLIDSWFYGDAVLTPMVYFDIQILQDRIANAGVSPWWNYLTDFIILAMPPISIPFILCLAFGIYKKPNSVFVFILIPFLVVHMAISHKEMRFMFPMMFSAIYLASVGFDYLTGSFPIKKSFHYVSSILYGINVCLLILAIFLPAQEAVAYYRYMYHPLRDQQVTMVCIKDSPYKLVGHETNFYKPPGSDIRVFADYEQIKNFLQRTQPDMVLFLSREPVLKHDFGEFKKERVYTLFPDWILEIQFSNWQERARTWSIYRVYKDSN